MSNFTEEPWIRDGRVVYALCPKEQCNIFFTQISQGNRNGVRITEQEAEDNAKLIAESPTLYEFVKAVMKIIEPYDDPSFYEGHKDIVKDMPVGTDLRLISEICEKAREIGIHKSLENIGEE